MSRTEVNEGTLLTLTREWLLPKLLSQRQDPSTPLRAWSIGCQTGDEALLLLLRLVAAQRVSGNAVPITLFATDPDANAVSDARRLASSTRLQTVSSLAPYHSLLQAGRDGLALPHPLRHSLIFGPHQLLKDVPFPRLNLIVCTLPLTRFAADQQTEVLQRLAYGLRPHGLLVLLAPGEVLPNDVLYQQHHTQSVPVYERTRAPASFMWHHWTPPAVEAPATPPTPDEDTHAVLEELQAALEEQLVRNQEFEALAQAYRRAEEAELYLAALVASSEDAILSKDLEGTITSWNAAAGRLYGYSAEEVIGKSVLLLFPPDRREEFVQIMTKLRQGQRVEPYETLRQRKDGSVVQVSLTVSPIKLPSGRLIGASAIARDITERKALERQREAEAFFNLITHELKTPLTTLQGNLQNAQRRLKKMLEKTNALTEEQQGSLEEVLAMLGRSHEQGRLQQRMIEELFELARLQRAQLTLHLAVWNLVKVVTETAQNFQAAHPARRLTLSLPKEAVISVLADRDRLQQVLNNYLTNALKFAPEAAPVQVGLAQEGARARVWVQDQGPGLAPEQQTRIWQRFYQVPQTPVQDGWKAGMGLGLSLCQQLIQLQQGEVGVESLPGQGATFWFTLPVHASSDSA
jgi:PAS domain S-box-containing protein